jgi:OHCU decarboxylase
VTGLEWFNELSLAQACDELRRCCGAERWVTRVANGRPYGTIEELQRAADKAWHELDENDWRAAIEHHPRIGEHARGWSCEEQSGVANASDQTRDRLAVGQRVYEERFGYIFLICATGKSGDEMATDLETRLGNSPETELAVAAEELRKITVLRLEKLFVEEPDHDSCT